MAPRKTQRPCPAPQIEVAGAGEEPGQQARGHGARYARVHGDCRRWCVGHRPPRSHDRSANAGANIERRMACGDPAHAIVDEPCSAAFGVAVLAESPRRSPSGADRPRPDLPSPGTASRPRRPSVDDAPRPDPAGHGRRRPHRVRGHADRGLQGRVIGVLENVGPKQSMILARLEGGPLEKTGVIAGMSGSPVYIDGKLVGRRGLRVPVLQGDDRRDHAHRGDDRRDQHGRAARRLRALPRPLRRFRAQGAAGPRSR